MNTSWPLDRVEGLCALQVQEVRHSRRYRSTKALDNGKRRGWTTHAALAASKWSSSTHTDPGPNYPLFGKVSFNALLFYYRARIAAGLKPMEAA
jgi:hypothetical protein